MSVEKLKGLIVFSILIGAAGLFLVFNSVNLGTLLAENWLSEQVDGVDTYLYGVRMGGSINNFLAVGSILFSAGLVSTILLYYKLLRAKE